jgi:hypothetical protein
VDVNGWDIHLHPFSSNPFTSLGIALPKRHLILLRFLNRREQEYPIYPGFLTCIGTPAESIGQPHPLTFIDKGIRIIGSAVGARGDIIEAITFVERGLVKPLIQKTKLENLSDIAKEFGKV